MSTYFSPALLDTGRDLVDLAGPPARSTLHTLPNPSHHFGDSALERVGAGHGILGAGVLARAPSFAIESIMSTHHPSQLQPPSAEQGALRRPPEGRLPRPPSGDADNIHLKSPSPRLSGDRGHNNRENDRCSSASVRQDGSVLFLNRNGDPFRPRNSPAEGSAGRELRGIGWRQGHEVDRTPHIPPVEPLRTPSATRRPSARCGRTSGRRRRRAPCRAPTSRRSGSRRRTRGR